jgi:NAD(P)-dependent dehydrogenase (short-subunit alcohol dehydrogenase family)
MSNLLPVDLVEPEDVAAAVAWLVSDDARYITGVQLPVDAGFLNKL